MFRIAVIVVGLVFLPRTLRAQCEYEVTAIIKAPPCAFTGTPATVGEAMNDDRVIVGWYADCETSEHHAFRWSQDTGFETLAPPPDGSDGEALDINDRGEVVLNFSITGIGFRGHYRAIAASTCTTSISYWRTGIPIWGQQMSMATDRSDLLI